MRLIGVAMVRNEADVVETFVRHNLAFLDHLVVVDHGSTDATAELLRELRAEGLPLTIGLDRSIEFQQGRVLSEAMRRALTAHDADYGFALDADEFIVAPSRAALEAQLARIGADSIGYLPWTLYVPSPAVPADAAHPFARLRHRIDDPRVTMAKVVVPRTFSSRTDRYIDSGNHWVFDVVPGAPQRTLDGVTLDARLAHLPFRSVAQTAQKVVLGHFAHRLAFGSGDDTAHINWHWRHVYERVLAGALALEDLALLAKQSYLGERAFEHAHDTEPPVLIEDPLPIAEPLRYASLARVDPLARLAEWTDRLIASLAR